MTDCPVTFPKEIPFGCVVHLGKMLAGKEPFDASDALQHAGSVLGCTGALLEGDAGPVPLFACGPDDKPAGEMTDEELCEFVETKGSTVGAAEAIPAWLLPIVAEIARRLFDRLWG